MIIFREGDEVFLSSCQDLCAIYKIVVQRDSKVFLQVTSSKDKGGKVLLGEIKLPKNIKNIPNGKFALEACNWFLKNLNMKSSYIRFNKEHTKCEAFLVMNDGREYSNNFGIR